MDLRYPVGPCEYPASLSQEDRARHMQEIAALPARLRQAVSGSLQSRSRPADTTVGIAALLRNQHVSADYLVGHLLYLQESAELPRLPLPYDLRLALPIGLNRKLRREPRCQRHNVKDTARSFDSI